MKKWLLAFALVVGFGLMGSNLASASPDYQKPVERKRQLQLYKEDFYIDGLELELGDERTVGLDYNKDGKVEQVRWELYRMVGQEVTITGYLERLDWNEYNEEEIYVTQINGMNFQNRKVRPQY